MRGNYVSRILFTCVVALASTYLLAEEATNKFKIRVGGAGLTGSEEYQIEKTAAGYRLTSKTHLEQAGGAMEMTQEQTLGADWSLERYKLEAMVGGQPQTIEAWRDGQQIQMRVSAGGQTPTQTAPFGPRTLVLDNLVTSHYQILLNRLAGKAEGNEEWSMLVPQRLAAVRGKLAAAQPETATLDGKPRQVRKYTLELGNVLVEFWAEADSNRLMRVFVPAQDVELVREGFALAPRTAAEPKGPAACLERVLTFPSGSLQVPATL
jgi:hypothetical protein